MLEVEARVLTCEIMADPLAVAMDGRGFGMALAVAEGFPVIALMQGIVGAP